MMKLDAIRQEIGYGEKYNRLKGKLQKKLKIDLLQQAFDSGQIVFRDYE